MTAIGNIILDLRLDKVVDTCPPPVEDQAAARELCDRYAEWVTGARAKIPAGPDELTIMQHRYLRAWTYYACDLAGLAVKDCPQWRPAIHDGVMAGTCPF